MTRAGLLLLTASATLVSGCVAVVPVVAAGAIAQTQMQKRHAVARSAAQAPAQPAAASPAPVSVSAPGGVPAGMQYLYGSGEAAALSMAAYQGLWTFLDARANDRRVGDPIASVVLTAGATLSAPQFAPCGDKPLAAVFDIDETVLLNLGYEADDARRTGAYDESRWQRWEASGWDKVAAVPGAAELIAAARRKGITIIYNSNRSAANAGATIAALDHADLGPAELGKTLWLRPEGAPSGKDARRWEIAQHYCVVALVGDQLGDFSDLFNTPDISPNDRRLAATQTMVAPLWGAGWFMLPNPVYGTGLKGGMDDVFPTDKRWTDPAVEK